LVPLETFQGTDGGEEHIFAIQGSDLNMSTFIKERPTAEMLSELGDAGRARKVLTMDGSNKKEFSGEGPRNNFVALNLKNKRLMCFTHQRKKGPTSGGKKAWLPPELFAKQQKHKWIQEVKERRCTDALQVAVACTDGPDAVPAGAALDVKEQFEQAISAASQVSKLIFTISTPNARTFALDTKCTWLLQHIRLTRSRYGPCRGMPRCPLSPLAKRCRKQMAGAAAARCRCSARFQ
jgi:hypothetical protein